MMLEKDNQFFDNTRHIFIQNRKNIKTKILYFHNMSSSKPHVATTQNQLLLDNLMEFYKNKTYLKQMMNIINGESNISLRIIDWFVTNFAKKNYTVFEIYSKTTLDGEPERKRFKVYNDY